MDGRPLDEGLIEQIVQQAAELAEVDDSARAEAWASSVLGLWREPGTLIDAAAADRQLAEALVAADTAAAAWLASALAAVAPAGSQEALLGAAADLAGRGDPAPRWASGVTTSRPGAAWVISDEDTGRRTGIHEFEAVDGAHTMLSELDGSKLRDVNFGPAAAELFEALTEPGADPLEPVPIDAAVLAHEILQGWGHALRAGVAPSDAWIMNRSLALRRLELFETVHDVEALGWGDLAAVDRSPEPDPADVEADAAALSTLTAALGPLNGPLPDGFETAAHDLRARIDDANWPASAIAAGGGLANIDGDVEYVLAAVGAYATRTPLPMPADEGSAVGALEWADWLGAVIQLVRGGVGGEVTPANLVDNVNRCPEVSTSIPRRDREYFETAFGLVIEAWEFCDCLDDSGRLTEFGLWAIPRGLARAWSGQPGRR